MKFRGNPRKKIQLPISNGRYNLRVTFIVSCLEETVGMNRMWKLEDCRGSTLLERILQIVPTWYLPVGKNCTGRYDKVLYSSLFN